MAIELFIDYISQPSRAVLAFCHLNSIPVTIKEIRIAKLQHLDESFATLNPMKRVPAIRDTENGLTLGESHAIMAYLSRKFNRFEHFRPGGNEQVLAKVEEYLHYHHANTRKCSLLLYSALFSKLYPVQQAHIPDEKAIRNELEGIFTFINANYFKESQFMVGKTLTVADLAAYFEMITLELLDFQFSRWENIAKWIKTMQAIPSVRQTNTNYKKMVPKMRTLRASL